MLHLFEDFVGCRTLPAAVVMIEGVVSLCVDSGSRGTVGVLGQGTCLDAGRVEAGFLAVQSHGRFGSGGVGGFFGELLLCSMQVCITVDDPLLMQCEAALVYCAREEGLDHRGVVVSSHRMGTPGQVH